MVWLSLKEYIENAIPWFRTDENSEYLDSKKDYQEQNKEINKRYEERRKDMNYYKDALNIIEEIKNENSSESIIDIGGWAGKFVSKTEINEKVCLDIETKTESNDDVRNIIHDFLTWKPDKEYDIAICMQTLEHISDEKVGIFARKLFEVSNHILISVPYMWKKGKCPNHLQDPVDENKIYEWMKRNPTKTHISTDKNMQRIICYYNESKKEMNN